MGQDSAQDVTFFLLFLFALGETPNGVSQRALLPMACLFYLTPARAAACQVAFSAAPPGISKLLLPGVQGNPALTGPDG